MLEDDRHVQRNWQAVLRGLCAGARARAAHVHVYPSQTCTYTIDKRRIFVCVRPPGTTAVLPDCVIQHVLLHEAAHVLNDRGRGHDGRFHRILDKMRDCADGRTVVCPGEVPVDYNTACRRVTAKAP